MKKKKCIIVDLDGTLANVDQRRSQLLQNNDWKKFNSAMNQDKLNIWCSEIINCFKEKYSIVLVTGRKDSYQPMTVAWLQENNVYYDAIFFRKTDDYRDDATMKSEIFKENIDPIFEPLFVVDDRKKVVTMWRNLGLVCLQCADGDF